MIAIVWLGGLLVMPWIMNTVYGCFIPVDVDVEAPAKVMRDSINGDIKDDGCEDTISNDYREVGLFLSTDTNLSLDVFAANLFADGWVFDQNAKCKQV